LPGTLGGRRKNSRKVAFAYLVRFSKRPETIPAIVTREGLLNRLFGETGPL